MAVHSKLIVDAIEWTQMLPKWVKTMNDYRRLRLDAVVYKPRQRLLASEYDNYVRSRSQDTPAFDLLPYVTDLARFPPFRDIIKAPEDFQMGMTPFVSAFTQLPALVEEWKKQLDAELAELVRIPAHLSLQDASSHQTMASSGVTSKDKLHLACALFDVTGHRILSYPEAFMILTPRQSCSPDEYDPRATRSILDRFNISFLEEAPYIVHACGLNPSVATSDDMDCRNARLRCLACGNSVIGIMDWRDAVCHFIGERLSMRLNVRFE